MTATPLPGIDSNDDVQALFLERKYSESVTYGNVASGYNQVSVSGVYSEHKHNVSVMNYESILNGLTHSGATNDIVNNSETLINVNAGDNTNKSYFLGCNESDDEKPVFQI